MNMKRTSYGMFNKLPHIHPTMAINKVYFTKYIAKPTLSYCKTDGLQYWVYWLHCQKEREGVRLTLGFVFLKLGHIP